MTRVSLVTDSACYIPAGLLDRYGIQAVPLNIQIGDQGYEEPELEPDDFYSRLAEGARATTSQPAPGQFIAAYQRAVADGAEAILSIHVGSNLSGTVQSARIAADSVDVPVTIVDTGQASFAEGLCVLEAAEALARGQSLDIAAALAEAASRVIGNTFVVRGMELVQRSGRLARNEETEVEGVPVVALTPEGVKVLASAMTLYEAVETMAGHITEAANAAPGRGLRVGVGHGAAPEVAAALRDRISGRPGIEEVIEYIVGPSVGAHVGPGNAGAVFLPRPVSAE